MSNDNQYDAPCGHCMTTETYEKHTPAPGVEEVVERFAALEHERWSNWQRWLHSQCFKNPEFFGALIIPADLVARWERQIATPYSELSEQEKESDRKQVYPYVEHYTHLLTTHQQEKEALVREIIEAGDIGSEQYGLCVAASKILAIAARHGITSDNLKS